MPRIGIFYGTTDGHTAAAAAELKTQLDAFALPAGEEGVELFDIADYYLDEMLDFDCLVLGIPTWNHGQLQRDWEDVLEEFDTLDLSGKRAAVFGLGDQHGYPDTFADAIFFLADKLRQQGASPRRRLARGRLHLQHLLGRRRRPLSRPRPRRTQPARPDRAAPRRLVASDLAGIFV